MSSSICFDPKYGDHWEFYNYYDNKWRWRRKGSNGRLVGASSIGFENKSDCIENAKRSGMTCTPD